MTYYKLAKNNESADSKKGKLILTLGAIFLIIVLSVFYLIQVNNLVAKNFELRAFQKIITQSQNKNQELTISLMQLRSLKSLEQAAKDLNLVLIQEPKYLKIAPGFFAMSD